MNKTSLEIPEKRYVTTIWLTPPGHRVFVDSWEEAMDIADDLRKRMIAEDDRSTTTVRIDPLEPTRFFYEERRQRKAKDGQEKV